MRRREFLMGTATRPAQASQQAKLDRLAIMTWSFDRIVKKPDDAANPERTLDVMDIPQMFVDRYGVRHVEMQHSHFASTEPEYLREFLDRVVRAGSRVSQINLEFGPLNISAPTNTARVQAIDLTKQWIDHAVTIGCPRVMINQGDVDPEHFAAAVATLRTMGNYGDQRSVWVTMENRGVPWPRIAELILAAGTYSTPDMGNFPDQETQHAGIRGLFPMHRGNAHVKLNPARYDLPAALALTKEIGYDGLYSIEANPGPVEPYQAVQNIKDVLMAHI